MSETTTKLADAAVKQAVHVAGGAPGVVAMHCLIITKKFTSSIIMT